VSLSLVTRQEKEITKLEAEVKALVSKSVSLSLVTRPNITNVTNITEVTVSKSVSLSLVTRPKNFGNHDLFSMKVSRNQ